MKNEMTPIGIAERNAERARWMVVDDNENILEREAGFLGAISDAEVCCFRSGPEALQAFAAAPETFELVVTDLEMPRMSGIDLCRSLRALAPRLKILLTTGCALITRREARQLGFCDLIAKPFPPVLLRRALEAVGVLDPDPAVNETSCMASVQSARAAGRAAA